MTRPVRFAVAIMLIATITVAGCSPKRDDSPTSSQSESTVSSPGMHSGENGRSIAVGLLAYNNPGGFYAVIEGRPGEAIPDPPKVVAIIVQPNGTTASSDLAELVGAYVEFTGAVVEDNDERVSAPRLAAESYRILEPAKK